MAQRLPHGYLLDPADPRAPTEHEWAAMTPAERAQVVAMLPAEVPWELNPPEGDWHLDAKISARGTLSEFFRRAGRRIYVSNELAVYYPGEKRFSPDILAVVDVDPHPRTKWVVADEGKGLDLVIEVHHEGDRRKDYETNVERYARLGIAEYFIFDIGAADLRGYRLSPPKPAYVPIVPQAGRWASHVLGLDLALEEGKIRFFQGTAALLEAAELAEKLGKMLDETLAKKTEALREAEERARRAEEEARSTADRLADAERRIREMEAEIERLRGGKA